MGRILRALGFTLLGAALTAPLGIYTGWKAKEYFHPSQTPDTPLTDTRNFWDKWRSPYNFKADGFAFELLDLKDSDNKIVGSRGPFLVGYGEDDQKCYYNLPRRNSDGCILGSITRVKQEDLMKTAPLSEHMKRIGQPDSVEGILNND
ncbi:MAG: hypothetical protein WC595_04435 [Candidatus Nanoarchaeia archaeon]